MALCLSSLKVVFSLMPEISLFEIDLFGLSVSILLCLLFEKALIWYVSKCVALNSETDMSSDLNSTACKLSEIAYPLCVSSFSSLK